MEPADIDVAGDDFFWSGRVNHFGLLVLLQAAFCGSCAVFLKSRFL